MDEMLSIQLKCDVDDFLNIIPNSSGWGFTMGKNGEITYVTLGSKRVVSAYLNEHDRSLVCMIFEGIRDDHNEMAQEMWDEVIDNHQAILVNGEEITYKQIVSELGETGNE